MELFWVIASAGALLIRAGFALYATGMARSKNSAATLMRHLCDLCVGVIAFWAVGYAISSGMHGTSHFVSIVWNEEGVIRELFVEAKKEDAGELVGTLQELAPEKVLDLGSRWNLDDLYHR